MINELRIIFVITFGLFFSFTNLFSQYHSKTIDISKKVTTLTSTEEGFLRYGTMSGEVGLFDGLLLDNKYNFHGEINSIKVTNAGTLVLTNKGLYRQDNDKITLLSQNTLDVIDVNEDLTTLITTTGMYIKSGSDYLPDSEAFYDVNEIEKGKFFYLNDFEYLWIDRNIYIKDRSWREMILHPNSKMDVISLSDRMIISDENGIISYDGKTGIDTLYRADSIGISKVFPIDNKKIIYCSDNKVNVLDLRKRELNYVKDINTELINASAVDNWDNIWLSAGSFLYQISDSRKSDTNYSNSPTIKIDKIKVNGVAQLWDKSIALDKGNNYIEISYVGMHLGKPQDLMYETKLSVSNNLSTGIEDINNWKTQGKRKEVEYRNLPAGKYTFQVRVSVDGKYHAYTEKVGIRVNDNSIQYYWLGGLLAAAFFFLMAIFFNTRYNRLKSNSEQERKLLIQENKMLSLQQKALQLQMNPHFVFNALNSIQGLIAKEDNKRARRYLQLFSSMMRSVLNQSRKETISLEEEIIYLKSYLSLEQMANNETFDFEIRVDDTVDDDVNIPTMIIQPFIENAIIHGVKGLKDRRGKITVSFFEEKSLIKCRVIDNGIGRDASSQNKHKIHKSIALEVVQDRLKNKGNRRNPVVFTDLKDENGEAIGTQVDVAIPVL